MFEIVIASVLVVAIIAASVGVGVRLEQYRLARRQPVWRKTPGVEASIWLPSLLIDDLSDYVRASLPKITADEVTVYEARQAWVKQFVRSMTRAVAKKSKPKSKSQLKPRGKGR